MSGELTWDDMLNDMHQYLNSCLDDEFIHYYNEMFSTQVKIEEIE